MGQIQFLRGLSTNLPKLTLRPGEPVFTLDTKKLIVSDGKDQVVINPDKYPAAETADKLSDSRNISISGDITAAPIAFDGTKDITLQTALKHSGVTAGTYCKLTVDARGIVTGGTTMVEADIPTLNAARIAESETKKFVTAAEKAKIATIDNIAGQISSSVGTEATARTAADTALGQRIDGVVADVATRATSASVQQGLSTKVDKTDLFVGGKINTNYIPALAITDTFLVKSQAEMLALKAEDGDIAIRSDINKTFILKGPDPSKLDSWVDLLTPTSDVTSVCGKKGAVVINRGDVGLGNVDNESKSAMFTNPNFTGTPTSPTPPTADNTTKIATTAFVKAQGYLTGDSIIDGGTF